jgi:hypothetical protein
MEEDDQRALIIHEICRSHISGHGLRWRRRMMRADQRALELRYAQTAELLAAQVKQYE